MVGERDTIYKVKISHITQIYQVCVECEQENPNTKIQIDYRQAINYASNNAHDVPYICNHVHILNTTSKNNYSINTCIYALAMDFKSLKFYFRSNDQKIVGEYRLYKTVSLTQCKYIYEVKKLRISIDFQVFMCFILPRFYFDPQLTPQIGRAHV